MSASPFSSQEIRATAEVHRELGPEYQNAVVESFLAKIEKEIEARVDARLAQSSPPRSRPLDPAKLAKRRLALRYTALGTVAAGIPLSWPSGGLPQAFGIDLVPHLVVVWILIAAVHAVAGAVLLQPWQMTANKPS
jgi:hypothetical protein